MKKPSKLRLLQDSLPAHRNKKKKASALDPPTTLSTCARSTCTICIPLAWCDVAVWQKGCVRASLREVVAPSRGSHRAFFLLLKNIHFTKSSLTKDTLCKRRVLLLSVDPFLGFRPRRREASSASFTLTLQHVVDTRHVHV